MAYLSVAQVGAPANILRIYAQLTDDERTAGHAWYRSAHDAAAALAERHGYPLLTVVGVIAALSPSVQWRQNLDQADKLLGAVQHERKIRLTAFPSAVAKAVAIARTGDISPLVGPKTTAFFANIAWPDCPGPVTVDRHALRIWANVAQSGAITCSARTYYLAVADYITAAEAVGVMPHEMQAATWLTLAKP